MMNAHTITKQLIEGGTVETYAAELAGQVTGSTITSRDCALVLSAIAEIKNRIGGWKELWTLEDTTEARREELFKASTDRQVASKKQTGTFDKPHSQYWDDDAPGGVIYE